MDYSVDNRLENKKIADLETIIINEVQLLLAEKRTSLAALRTGIAVIALPITVISVLIATSKYYDIVHVIHLIVPLLTLCAALVFLGSYLIIRSIIRIRHYDWHISEIKRKHSTISDFID
jgi:uncharacterized membrane protein YidH (DUF202 family)